MRRIPTRGFAVCHSANLFRRELDGLDPILEYTCRHLGKVTQKANDGQLRRHRKTSVRIASHRLLLMCIVGYGPQHSYLRSSKLLCWASSQRIARLPVSAPRSVSVVHNLSNRDVQELSIWLWCIACNNKRTLSDTRQPSTEKEKARKRTRRG